MKLPRDWDKDVYVPGGMIRYTFSVDHVTRSMPIGVIIEFENPRIINVEWFPGRTPEARQ